MQVVSRNGGATSSFAGELAAPFHTLAPHSRVCSRLSLREASHISVQRLGGAAGHFQKSAFGVSEQSSGKAGSD